MNPKEILEPTLPQELNVAEGIEDINDHDWNEVTTDQQDF